MGIQLAKFKVLIKCHWTKGKGFHKDIDLPSDEEVSDDENNELAEEPMEDDET